MSRATAKTKRLDPATAALIVGIIGALATIGSSCVSGAISSNQGEIKGRLTAIAELQPTINTQATRILDENTAGRQTAITEIQVTMEVLTTNIAATQQVSSPPLTPQLVEVTPTTDPNITPIEALAASVSVYNGADDSEFGAGLGKLAILQNGSDIDYSFEYNIPDQGKAYSKIVFRLNRPTDLTQYSVMKVTASFSNPEARCEIELRDNAGGASYIRFGENTFPGGNHIEAAYLDGKQIIHIPLESNFASTDKRVVQEVGYSANADFTRGRHICNIHDINFFR